MADYKEKMCLVCNRKFKPNSPTQKYCQNCRVIVSKEKDKEREKVRNRKRGNYKEYYRVCKYCGKSFSTYYSRKIYCGSEECEKYRKKLKNTLTHQKRDKSYMLEKGKKYYDKNKELCCRKKAESYRKKVSAKKAYKYGRVYNHNIEYVKNYVEKYGYKLLSKSYKNNREKIKLVCPRGHEWETSFHNFKDMENRCPTCKATNNYISSFELDVREKIKEIYSGPMSCNDRSLIINPNTGRYLELDIYLPKLNKAIECNGEYWHKDIEVRAKDKLKIKLCNDKGIKLKAISDKYWYSTDDNEKIKLIKDFIKA